MDCMIILPLQYLNSMQNKCDCKDSHPHKAQIQDKKISHLINLLRNHFISPYKIMYMLDPKQADYFKSRNQSSGCCSSNHITIGDQELTKTERYLKELISYSSLLSHLNFFLQLCYQRYGKIIQSGKKDGLEVTNDVQKFILDKVMTESINNHIFVQLTNKIKEQSNSNNREIGLWATPATWHQKYPNKGLNYLQAKFIAALVNQGYAITKNYVSNEPELFKELSILEKDGKFEQSKYVANTKILNNAEKYIQIKSSNDCYLFEQTREAIIKLSSIPFQLNAKANLFCTVSPNLHILYSKTTIKTNTLKGDLKYTMLINIHKKLLITIGQEQLQMPNQSMIVLDNSKIKYEMRSEQGPLFLFINFIGCVQRK